MATLKAIKNSLITILDAVQVGGQTAFVDVLGYPVDSIEGAPIGVVLVEDGQSEFDTNNSNERTDVFAINMLIGLELPGGILTRAQAVDNMYDLMDAVRDALDDSQDLSGSVLYMNPSLGSVGLGTLQSGQTVVGTVRVAVRHLHEIS